MPICTRHSASRPPERCGVRARFLTCCGQGATFAHGKRQRLRQAGLWLVDPDSYYNGRYVTVADEGATLPVRSLGPRVSSLEAIEAHLAEARHRSAMLRSLLGIAKVSLTSCSRAGGPNPLKSRAGGATPCGSAPLPLASLPYVLWWRLLGTCCAGARA